MIAGTIPSSQISSHAILYMSSSIIVNITCGACKNIVTHPIEILSCNKLTCRDCCLNLVCKKTVCIQAVTKIFAIQFFSSHTNRVYVFLKRKLLNGRAAVKVWEALKGLLLEERGVRILYLVKKERLSVKNVAKASTAHG